MHSNPSILEALGRLRGEEYRREAAEWRAALLALQSHPDSDGALRRALAWWRSRFSRGRAERTPAAEPERP